MLNIVAIIITAGVCIVFAAFAVTKLIALWRLLAHLSGAQRLPPIGRIAWPLSNYSEEPE
jgi:hypothetical protein